jgi:hypothetical protein
VIEDSAVHLGAVGRRGAVEELAYLNRSIEKKMFALLVETT